MRDLTVCYCTITIKTVDLHTGVPAVTRVLAQKPQAHSCNPQAFELQHVNMEL